jgi:dCMP deaminase
MKWHRRFLSLAKLVASWSHDPSTKVGAVITLPSHRVLSVGFNGFPADMPDDPSYYHDREEKYHRIIHAEVNALLFAPSPLPKQAILYTYPFMPCDRCVVQMLQAGIRDFVSFYPGREERSRWGESFERSRQYIEECQGTLLEIR